jgi:uncharacterized protein
MLKYLASHPLAFPDRPRSVRMIETYTSTVFLTGKNAYKIKKPVDYGYLDFSTLEKRKHFCEQELILNRRLAPELYLAVLPVTKTPSGYRIGGKGEIIDWCVQMKELPQERMMTELVRRKQVSAQMMKEVIRLLSDFFRKSETSTEISSYGDYSKILYNVEENFSQTKPFVGDIMHEDEYKVIVKAVARFMSLHKALFAERVKQGFIRDCHGDLHTGNIFIDDGIHVFDCIEFNERFRYGDVMSDAAFLAMDLDFLGEPSLSRQVEEAFSDDRTRGLLSFYKCYRAFVRYKIAVFRLQQKRDPAQARDARRYALLALKYAGHLHKLSAGVIIMSGLSGTGKSYWARQLSSMGALIIKSDDIRKELHADVKNERYGSGAFTADKRKQVYDQMFRRVAKKAATVLDATFISRDLRDAARRLHDRSVSVLVSCTDEDRVRKRLQRRAERGYQHSQAGWDIYLKQKETFEHGDFDATLDTAADELSNWSGLVVALDRRGFYD